MRIAKDLSVERIVLEAGSLQMDNQFTGPKS